MLKVSLLPQWTMMTSSCPRGIRVLTAQAELFAELFGGGLYNKTSICPLTEFKAVWEFYLPNIWEKCVKENLCKLNWRSNQDVVVSYNKTVSAMWP